MENINKAVQELVEQWTDAEPEDPPPKPFKFNEALDKVGLPLESADYVKRSCKHCLGRGYRTFLIGDGYMNLAADGNMVRVPRQARSLQACICVHRGYSRTRLAYQRRYDQETKAGKESKEAAALALLSVGYPPSNAPASP